MRREAHEAASESCEKTGWGAPECPEKLSQVKSSGRIYRARCNPITRPLAEPTTVRTTCIVYNPTYRARLDWIRFV